MSRTEPQSFNVLTRRDGATRLVFLLAHARLFRINAATQELEPWLVENWTRSDSGLEYRLSLRAGVTFSDGRPLTADDVVFSLAAAYDPASVGGDSLLIGGERLRATANDQRTVTITFPAAFAPGLRLLDSLPILPKHKLEAALSAGSFGTAWAVSTPVAELAGLGPFVVSSYAPGERVVFSRNPRYFRKDAAGEPLPYLDRVIVEVVPDPSAQLVRLQSGQADSTSAELPPADYAQLKRAVGDDTLQLIEAGIAQDPDGLWINLTPNAFAADPRRVWIQRDELREAISLAVNRQLFVDTVYLGAGVPAYGPITASNKLWYSDQVAKTPYDPSRAKALLGSIGLIDRNGDGMLDDPSGRPARLTILTAKGQTALERGAFVIADELKKIGLGVDVSTQDGNAVAKQFVSGRGYDAVYYHLTTSDTDPATNADFWRSSGSAHVWNIEQKSPATDWERELDDLMSRQAATFDDAERKQLFVRAQQLFAAHRPMLYFGAPKIFVAASKRMLNLTPGVNRPQLLWAADTIAVRH